MSVSVSTIGERLTANGGFSMTVDGTEPTDGFMVAIPHAKSLVYRQDASDRATVVRQIRQWIVDIANLADDNPNVYLGGWVEDDGTVWLEPSERHASLTEALSVARLRGEKAVYDIVNGCDVYV